MGPKVSNAPQYAGSVPGNIQDFWKPTRARSSQVSNEANRCSDPSIKQDVASPIPLPAGLPAYHASELGPWCAVISYDACVRLCLKYYFLGGRDGREARVFLENECSLLQTAFCLEQNLLQPEEELLSKRASESVVHEVIKKPQKTFGKLKVQVKKVKMSLDGPNGCTFSSIKKPPVLKLQRVNRRLSTMKSTVYSEWEALKRVRGAPKFSSNGSLSHQSMAYLQYGTLYLRDMAGLLKVGITSLHNASTPPEPAQETYLCSLRLKSSSDADMTRMQPGSCETHVFLPDGMTDDLIIEVTDSKGKYCGHVIAQMADIADDLGDKLRWWPIYREPEHEPVGRIQLNIHYSTGTDENNNVKCGIVAETIAYDSVLEAAMKAQNFKQRNLLLHGSWRWLVTKFATYYGVSDAYAKLRYLSYVMDVATPTADCLNVIHDLLSPVITGKMKGTLSSQENRMLVKLSDKIEETIALVFENYKSLDENSPSGLTDKPTPVSGFIAPALKPALKIYNLLHDIQSPEAQLQLCKYFQIAVRKILGRHLAETNELVCCSSEKSTVDEIVYPNAYQNMKSLCLNIRNEIISDTKINNQQVLPSFLELPNLSSCLYSSELCNRIRGFLISYPPISLSPPVTDLIITTCDFQKDLAYWNISPVKGGVDAKELFHIYITRLIHDKHLDLLESCKLDKCVGPQVSTSTFVDDMYKQLKETLCEFQVIISRWPEYTLDLEKVIADTERVIMETLEKKYNDILSPLKENTISVKAVQYVQRFAKGNSLPYSFPEELGTLFNSMKKMLDVRQPEIEKQFKSLSVCISQSENAVPGELLSEVTVMLRTKFRNYMQAAVEKLAGNTKLQNTTNLKKVIQEAKESVGESDIRNRMQCLKDILTKTINDLHGHLENHVFIIVCQALWDRMGQDVLRVLENRKENWTCKASRVAVDVLNETFRLEMQRLVGDKDVEAPRSILEVQSILCK
ncbi:hypothetical protein SSX86_016039 [Deinandra increscens subsp. villosa]|uniref:Uncharacterized protein n=1 Tax=Deinandra increscens subsp. villosa TaxID=3103831 RepID=A0AAP0D1Z6_9ASTR